MIAHRRSIGNCYEKETGVGLIDLPDTLSDTASDALSNKEVQGGGR